MYRQGDVLLMPVEAASGKKEKRDRGAIVLAYGEATGHRHAIHSPEAVLVAENGERYLQAFAEVDLVHEEHDTIRIPAGNYRVIQQQEVIAEIEGEDEWADVRD